MTARGRLSKTVQRAVRLPVPAVGVRLRWCDAPRRSLCISSFRVEFMGRAARRRGVVDWPPCTLASPLGEPVRDLGARRMRRGFGTGSGNDCGSSRQGPGDPSAGR